MKGQTQPRDVSAVATAEHRRSVMTRQKRSVFASWCPLDISFEPSVLRTGDCLVRIGCGETTSHITWEKSAKLKAACPSKKPKPRHKIPKEIDKIWDDVNGNSKYVTPRCFPERVDFWTLARAEEFNPAEWTVLPLPCMPAVPQPPPKPLPNAGDYSTFFIPSIRKRTAAKTEKGQRKFKSKIEEAWANRKRLYECGKKLLRDAGFFKHSNDMLGPADQRDSCPRCGCSVFVPKRKKLVCYDCGYIPRYRQTNCDAVEGDETIAGEVPERKSRQVSPRLTQREFKTTLLIEGRFNDLADPEERRKIVGSYLQLCEGWLPADVQKEPGFQGETESAIRQRAARLINALRKHEQAGRPLLEPSANQIACLQENLGPNGIVT